MLIKEKMGNLSSFATDMRKIERLPLEWYECSKRILHKKTDSGREVTLKFLKEAQHLQQDDVLYADDHCMIVVEVLACQAVALQPTTMYEMALVCYEIGNKHLPLFYQEDMLLIPYDAPTFRLLQASGLKPELQMQKLVNQLQTTVLPHAHSGGESLFSKILKLTSSNE
ncbi:MAG TPA: urease accessory protein UreE [Flavisolibacter sp.]|nr:urease accessory protein UreE [Flavisolibacter sp.]